MKITEKKISKTRVQQTVEFTDEQVGEFFQRAVTRLSSSVKIPGFRPGKAPKNLVKENLDEENLREEAYSLAVSDAWKDIVKDLKVVPIHDPEVEIVEFAEGAAGKISFEFDIRPEVKVGKWESISTKSVKPTKIEDKEVEEVLQSLAKGHAKRVMTLEKAKKGNQIDVEFTGSIGGVRKDKLTSKHFPVILGESRLVPGFEEQLHGLKKGDVKKFSQTFPKDYFDKELAGAKVDFEIKVEEVYTIEEPKLDSKFAEKFGHKKLEEMKQAIRDDLESRNQDEFEQRRKAKWLADFEKLVETEVPQSLLLSEMSRSEQSWREYLSQHNIKEGDWLARHGLTMDKLRNDWEKAAKTSVTIGLGLSELANSQGRDLKTNEDFQNFLDELIEKTSS